MLDDIKLSVYFSLQKIILTSPDTVNLLDVLLQESINRLNFIGFRTSFLASVFVEEDKEYFVPSPTNYNAYLKAPNPPPPAAKRKVSKSSLVEAPGNKIVPLNPVDSALNMEILLQGSDWAKQLRGGMPLVLLSSDKVIKDTYSKKGEIKSIFITPSYTAEKQEVWLILATPLNEHEITQDDLNLIRMIGNLLTFSLKLQDAENLKNSISQEVYKMNVKLHELDKLKDDFVSVASHELRTPMTAIRSYAWMALYRADVPLSEKMKKYLSRTLISTERLINLVNDMLNISRIESGRVEIAPKAFNIQELMADAFNEIGPKAAEKKLQVRAVNTPMPIVFADPDKIHQVILNLLGNALKFTPAGGSITVSYFTDGQVVDVSVTDSGVGISKEDMSRLFKKFGRLDNSYVAAATSGGTGLGLYICKSLVELMKGKIWATSEGMGKGTTFSFSMPVATKEVLAHPENFASQAKGEAKNLEPVAI